MARIAQRSASPAKTKRSSSREAAIASPPDWIEPQLCKLVERAPSGDGWVHEIKLDGYRMAARIDRGDVQLLTRSGLDWTEKYPGTAQALAKPPVTSAYIDGELCGVRADGVTTMLAAASSPLDAYALAAAFRQGRRIAPKIAAVLAALSRMGFVTIGDDGRTFVLRRAA